MDKSIILAWAIKNSLCVLCWVALAMVFNKWWIALFGLLFMDTLSFPRYYRVCDKCGKHSPYANNYNEALDNALKIGWIHIVDGNKDYCPDCQEQVEYETTKQESEKYSEPTECNHDWVLDETRIHTGGEDRYYHCRHCGAIKLDNSHGVSYKSGEWKP